MVKVFVEDKSDITLGFLGLCEKALGSEIEPRGLFYLTKWFSKRFNQKIIFEDNDINQYFVEWVQRYQKGTVYFLGCMDSESLKLWYETIPSSLKP